MLEVYSRNGETPVWYQGAGTVTLNLGYGKYPTISMECYEKIKDCLVVREPEERTIYENRRKETSGRRFN